MKKLALTLCIVFITSCAYADIIVYYDKDTSKVQFIIEDGQRIKLSSSDNDKLKSKKLKGNIRKYDLTEAYTDYKLVGNNFIVNTQKISDRINAALESEAQQAQKLLDQESAKVKLMSLEWTPLTEDEADSIIK